MLPLTPDMVAAVYECLRQFPPLSSWKLPPAEEVEFRVNKQPNTMGEYTRYARTVDHIVIVSSLTIGHFATLASVVAHEMVHLKQALDKTEPTRAGGHNAEFRRLAKQVCKIHGWDYKAFV
ncbi:MAG: SprT-like domain-containing protein [Betaproteobacteria bacterium]|nr:SprT-like domain-containing protein [Betaproteobacteria bacterium]